MTDTTATAGLVGSRRTVDTVYTYLLTLFFAGVIVQVFLAGVGAFGDHAAKIEKATSFDPHRALGSVLGLVAIVLFILALVARESRKTVLSVFVLALLAAAAQSGLASGGESSKWVGGLHALDGFVIVGLAGWLTGAAHRRRG